ncbi:MAG TPA: zf-TFIIB domain-containing protein [Dehalococcoidia bacterium]
MNCPIDGSMLVTAREGPIALERCPVCRGEWMAPDQLDALQVAASSEQAVAGTLEYGEHPSTKKCPVCAGVMTSFDFRGQALELDACAAGDGFWLDGGEEGKLRQLMHDRDRDLQRSSTAEFEWNQERLRGFTPNLMDRIRSFVQGR